MINQIIDELGPFSLKGVLHVTLKISQVEVRPWLFFVIFAMILSWHWRHEVKVIFLAPISKTTVLKRTIVSSYGTACCASCYAVSTFI